MPSAGRPTKYKNPMRQTAVWLPEEMINWLKSQPETVSETIRNLVEEKMNAFSNRTWYIIEHAGLDYKLCAGMTAEEIAQSLQGFFDQNPGDDTDPTAEEIQTAAEEIVTELNKIL